MMKESYSNYLQSGGNYKKKDPKYYYDHMDYK